VQLVGNLKSTSRRGWFISLRSKSSYSYQNLKWRRQIPTARPG